MKKVIFGLIVFVLLFSLIFTQSPNTVFAAGVGEGNWVLPSADAGTTYSTVNIEKAAESAPSWVRLFSEGIKISVPTKLCYSFRRGAYHWVPKIMQLKKSGWVNVNSTIEYLNGSEGGTFACASPKEAGTFALFAYYNGPQETISQPGKLFTVGSWTWEIFEDDGYDDIIANQINWDGYPTATQLVIGMSSSINFEITGMRKLVENRIDISGQTYPQNQNINQGFGGSFGEDVDPVKCRTIPFVELRDADDNVLAEIKNTVHQFWCSS